MGESPIFKTRQFPFTLDVPSFKRVDNNSEAMNIDGDSAGTPTPIWNGEATYWTPSGIGSAEAYAHHSGSYGWDSGVAALNDATRFDGGANQDIAGTYDSFSFWMQPKAYPPGSRFRVGWRNAANAPVGVSLLVENYTTNMDLDVWQRVTIPIADFALTADVDKICFDYRNAAGQRFYLDDIEVNTASGGGPYRFRIAAPDETVKYHLTMAVLVLAAPGSGWNPTSFANISGGLENGLLLNQRRLSTQDTLWRLNSKDNIDLFGRFHPQDDITFANGDLLVGFMVKPGNASVVITDDDVLDWVVRDDLSGLSVCRAYAHYGIEVVS